MEHLLIALDATPASMKCVRYAARLLGGAPTYRVTLFHVMGAAAPNLLTRDEVRRIEGLQGDHPHLRGFFWAAEDERRMREAFSEARGVLAGAGVPPERVSERFTVAPADVADAVLAAARDLGCTTIVLGRRGLGRVKEFFLGSVSTTVTRLARDLTVWVVDS